MVDPDELRQRRFRRDAQDFLEPDQVEAIIHDEHNAATVLANDKTDIRAKQLMNLASDHLHHFADESSDWQKKLVRIGAIAGAVYTLWQVRKHFRNKEHK